MNYFYAKIAREFDLPQTAPRNDPVIAKRHADVSRRLKRRAIAGADPRAALYIHIQNARACIYRLRRAYIENRPGEAERPRKEIKAELGRIFALSQRIERGKQNSNKPGLF